MLRFVRKVGCEKEKTTVETISLEELNRAKIMTVKLIQGEEFEEEIKALKDNRQISLSSRVLALRPYLDDYGILRVGGRLRHAAIPEEGKHPILLSAAHHFTTLLIIQQHEKLFHVGVQTTLREEFWPLLQRAE